MILSTMNQNNIIFRSGINVQGCRKNFEYLTIVFVILVFLGATFITTIIF